MTRGKFRWMIFFLAVLFLCTYSVPVAEADSVTDTISIYVGYFGWPEDQFVEKATYKWSNLDSNFGGALDTKITIYSYYSGSRTYLVAGRGFTLRDLLEQAGIDLTSIASIDFYTKDHTAGPYRSFTKYSILDMPRYYFPNLASNGKPNGIYPYDGGNLQNGASRVETTLALEDYTEWDAVGYEFEKNYDKDMMNPSSRFHLFFGQAIPKEVGTSSAAKYVHKIFVTFAGSPVLSTKDTNINLKVGSDFRVNLEIAAEDKLLDSYVAGHILWNSSDKSVATVDSTGKLNVKKDGNTIITASFGKSSVSVNVKVGDGKGGSGGNSGGGQGVGGKGSENQKSQVGGMESSNPVAIDQLKKLPDSVSKAPEKKNSLKEKKGVYLLSDELMSRADYVKWVGEVTNPHSGVKNNPGTLSQTSNIGMDDDAQQLVLLKKSNNYIMIAISLILTAFFLIGFAYGILSFKYHLKKN